MIRKFFNLIPKRVQEKIKLLYYNNKISGYSFSIEEGNYQSKAHKGWSILTLSPLYFIVKDVQRYERFYEILPGDVVIDAGANEGILSLIYSQKVTESGSIFAFEPDSKNRNTFQKNLSLNTATQNIFLHKKGLWRNPDIIDFFEAGTVGSSMFYEGSNAIKKQIEVTSLDEFVKLENLRKLDFIKMDIEGAEIEALAGAVETINFLRPNFAIASYHKIDGDYTYLCLEEFFKEIGYPYKTIFYDDGEIITYAGDNLTQNILIE